MRVRHEGFTLIELAIVLVIIGLLVLLVLRPASLIEGSQTKDLISIANDYKVAIPEFKERYRYYPGDLPDANNDLSNISVGCLITAATDPNRGNGQIDRNGGASPDIESFCVNEHLNRAGLINIPPGNLVRQYQDRQIAIRVIALADSNLNGVLPAATIRHIVEYSNVPLSMALGIDTALDDGNLVTGNVQRSDTATPLVDPVPFLGVKLD